MDINEIDMSLQQFYFCFPPLENQKNLATNVRFASLLTPSRLMRAYIQTKGSGYKTTNNKTANLQNSEITKQRKTKWTTTKQRITKQRP